MVRPTMGILIPHCYVTEHSNGHRTERAEGDQCDRIVTPTLQAGEALLSRLVRGKRD